MNTDKEIKKLQDKLVKNERKINSCNYILENYEGRKKVVEDIVTNRSKDALNYGLGVPPLIGALIGGFITAGIPGVLVGAAVGLGLGVVGTVLYMTNFTNEKRVDQNILKDKRDTVSKLSKENKQIIARLAELGVTIEKPVCEEYVSDENKQKPQVALADNCDKNVKTKNQDREL